MGTVEVDFDIPEEIGRVRHWFMEALRPLAGVRYREKPGVELVLESPRARKLDDPDFDTMVTEIVIAAHRIKTRAVPSAWQPQFLIERFEAQTFDLGRLIVFRLTPLGGGTYVMASCAERPSTAWKVFEDFLKQIEARYPALGPFWRKYAAQQRERMKEDVKRRFGDTGPVAVDLETPAKAWAEGGRRRIQANEWARRQVHIAGRDPLEVYPEWCRRYAAETGRRVNELANPKEYFKKLLKLKPK